MLPDMPSQSCRLRRRRSPPRCGESMKGELLHAAGDELHLLLGAVDDAGERCDAAAGAGHRARGCRCLGQRALRDTERVAVSRGARGAGLGEHPAAAVAALDDHARRRQRGVEIDEGYEAAAAGPLAAARCEERRERKAGVLMRWTMSPRDAQQPAQLEANRCFMTLVSRPEVTSRPCSSRAGSRKAPRGSRSRLRAAPRRTSRARFD